MKEGTREPKATASGAEGLTRLAEAAWRRALAVTWGLRLLVFFGVLWVQGHEAWQKYSPNHWLYGDGSFYINILRGLVEHGSLDQGPLHPHSWFTGNLGWNYNLTEDWSNVAVGGDGVTWYPKHSFLMPLFAVPFYLAGGIPGTLWFCLICAALSATLAAELAARYTRRWVAAAIGLAMGSAAAITHQGYGFNNDVFYTVLIVGAAVELCDRRWLLAGLWAGVAVLAKNTNVLFFVPFGIWVLSTRDRRSILRFAAGAAVGLTIFAMGNWIMFGAPWITAYQRVLAVHNGAQEIQSHLALFTRDFGQGLGAIWSELWRTLPAYPLALAGCAVLAYRQRYAEAAAFALALIGLPLFFAKYIWYRQEFLDPSFALAAAPWGAIAGLVLAPRPTPPTPVRAWGVGFAAAGLCLAALIGLRAVALARDHRDTLASLVPDSSATKVFLGEVPCDYFNNQVARWECSGFDRGQEWAFTGQTLDHFPSFDGGSRSAIALNPNPTGQLRRLIFTPAWKSQLVLGYGIADGAASTPVEFVAKLGDRELVREQVAAPGWHAITVETVPGSRTPLELTVAGQATPARLFFVDGELR